MGRHRKRLYHPDLCLIVPHSVNLFYENIEVGIVRYYLREKQKKCFVTSMGCDRAEV